MAHTKQRLSARLRAAYADDYGTAEQLPVTTTYKRFGDELRGTSHLLSGKRRATLHGEPVKTVGDTARFGQHEAEWIYAIWWRTATGPGWVPVPSIDACQEWTIDSVCPTPDGDIVEPDHPDAWLRLLGLV